MRKKTMKKTAVFIIMIWIISVMGILSGCGGKSESESAVGSKNNLQIVTTVFPEYDWTRQILGENPGNAELALLLDKGVDLHSYQPSAKDILNISTCDLFIYIGGESSQWVKDALQEAVNENMIVIDLLEVLGDRVKEEELVEGMQQEAEEEEEIEYDEHVWLSLQNASALCDAIANALISLDEANAETYRSNVESYKAQLAEMDQRYQQLISESARKSILFGDRFPFRYLVDDYGLDYYAAFAGCSAETEASFETILYLAGKVDELSMPCVLTIDGSDQTIAQTIVSNTEEKNQKILVLDSMQSCTMEDIENGTTYLSIMEKDLDVLKEALN